MTCDNIYEMVSYSYICQYYATVSLYICYLGPVMLVGNSDNVKIFFSIFRIMFLGFDYRNVLCLNTLTYR